MLEEISLDPGPVEEQLVNSRPIGGDEGSKLHRVYYSTNLLSEGEERRKVTHVRLSTKEKELHPGTNSITVKGKVSAAGLENTV